MIRKLLCWLGFHEWDVEVVRCNIDGPECCLTYDESDNTFKVFIVMNFYCKHCKKHLGSKIIRASFSAKDIGFREVGGK